MARRGGVEAEFNAGRCRIENGIAFGDDTLAVATGSPESGYTWGRRAPLTAGQLADPDGWAYLEDPEAHRTESDEWIVTGGETSWEGEGFVALRRRASTALVWVLCLDNSEGFVELALEGDHVRGRSGGYPNAYEWTIPLDAPERLRVVMGEPD